MSSERRETTTVISRRRLFWLTGSIGALVAAGASGVELVAHGVLPGRQYLNQVDGACSVAQPSLDVGPVGPSESGHFYSRARQRQVGYTLAYPPGHKPGSELPLVVMLHGFGDNHSTALVGLTPAQAVALRVNGAPLAPVTLVTVDGGDGYWNPHPGDDPLAMVVDELIPWCQRRGLGTTPHRIGLMGISMGGYGALTIAERHPELVAAVAAISPAVWTSYSQARNANAMAFASSSAFDAGNVITHAARLGTIPVRVAIGVDDPFYPGVERLVVALPKNAVVDRGGGCHTDAFFLAQEPPSLEFLATHLTTTRR
ncbi:MAG: alpha/beta hydrolase [Acidimicrobiales bacterium]